MAHRFEFEPAASKDAMTEEEVRTVLARLADERTAPTVADVAAASGASEAEIRRILQEVRSEQTPVEVPLPAAAVPAVREAAFPMGRSRHRAILFAVMTTLLVMGLLLSLTLTSTREVVSTSSPAERQATAVETTAVQPVAAASESAEAAEAR